MNEAIQLINFGGYDKMKIRNISTKLSSPNNVIIEMKACGLNFSDIYVRQGVYTLKNIQPPLIMGTEGAGIVREVGTEVKNFKESDRVLCWSFEYGLFSKYVDISSDQCLQIPSSMTFEEAAAIPINYTTAYFAVFGFGNISPGQSILIQSAAGGVGWAATQLANTVTNVTSFGTATSSKHQYLKENGITHTIDYRTTDFVTEILKISPKGIHIIVDCLSGNDFTRSQMLLRDMGRLIHIGMNNAVTGENKNIWNLLKVWWQAKDIKLLDIINKNHSICGLHVANIWEREPDTFKKALNHILEFYKEGKIKPRIDSRWKFEQVASAQKHMIDRKNIGKIILIPNDNKET